jgi:DNA-binding response OmpR family regulator
MSSIVIYERDDLMYSLLREWLSAAGYTVSESSAPVELVVASFSTSKYENEMLIRGARRIHPQAAIIALSSQARSGLSSDGAAATALGVERVMAKPLTRGELLAAVESIIGPPNRTR